MTDKTQIVTIHAWPLRPAAPARRADRTALVQVLAWGVTPEDVAHALWHLSFQVAAERWQVIAVTELTGGRASERIAEASQRIDGRLLCQWRDYGYAWVVYAASPPEPDGRLSGPGPRPGPRLGPQPGLRQDAGGSLAWRWTRGRSHPAPALALTPQI